VRKIALLACVAVLASPAWLSAASRTYVVDAAQSLVQVMVGKSGAFSFAGHEHEVLAPSVSGEVVADPDDLATSVVSLSFEAAALKVTGKGEPAKDVPKVQEKMVGAEVLDATRHPTISFRSRSVAGRKTADGAWDVQVTGELTLRGVSRPLTVPLRVQIAGQSLSASGRAVIRQKDFGIQPVSAAGGTVKVKNELVIDCRIVARAAP
jgi:polyisoprenoid-binding protein YceI